MKKGEEKLKKKGKAVFILHALHGERLFTASPNLTLTDHQIETELTYRCP